MWTEYAFRINTQLKRQSSKMDIILVELLQKAIMYYPCSLNLTNEQRRRTLYIKSLFSVFLTLYVRRFPAAKAKLM